MDGRYEPFGMKRVPNAANQARALHLQPYIATVPRCPDVLQVFSDKPLGCKTRYKAGKLSCFLTHLTLPAAAKVRAGDDRTNPRAGDIPALISSEKAVFIRPVTGALDVRILLATTTVGATAPDQ